MSRRVSDAEVERHRADVERRSIGPVGSAVMIAAVGPEIFLKVRWSADLERVERYAARMEEFDSATRWGAVRQDGPPHFFLEIEWPEVPATALLYFHGGKWTAELEIIRDLGVVNLVAEDAQGVGLIQRAIAVQDVQSDLLTRLLA